MENYNERGAPEAERGRSEQDKRRARRKAWRAIRPVLITLISLAICFFAVRAGYKYVMEGYIEPVDKNDATPITVTVPKSYGASAIAKLLYEACGEGEEGLISNKAVFKVYVDFTGKAGKLRAGTYVLSKNMDVAQIVDVICEGNPPKQTVKLTVPEGTNVEAVAAKLVELGVFKTPDEFLEACRTGEQFTDFSFVTAIKQNPEQARDYLLEGYLFPDTYEIYTDASAKTIINKMLVRFFEIFTDEYSTHAAELGMSIDDVVTLASLIEKEAKTADFTKVSAVFHNRLKEDMNLGSDAPLAYIYKTSTLEFTQEQMANPSLYNTHVHKGLPLGPVTNPGQNAILAAINPDEEYLKEGYLYFCLKDGKTGELVFAKTLEEHQANVEKYKENW